MNNCIKYTLNVSDAQDEDDFTEVKMSTNVCGWYTLDSTGDYCEDKKYIKYLHMPQSLAVNFDLTKTHADDVLKPQNQTSETINNILKWITIHSKDETSGNFKSPDAEFVCYRGLLSRIMWIPYEKSESLMVCAVKLRGTIYLCRFATEQNKESMQRMQTKEMETMSHYGFKFEQYMLADKPNEEPNVNQPLSEYEEMNCVYQSQLGQHKFLYGAEVDGLPNEESLTDLNSAKMIELKTCKENPSPYSFKRYKLLKWWAQSWLVNIDMVVVGYRDDNKGVVNKLEKIKVADMPVRATRTWSANCCINFLNDFLNFVKFVMRDAPENDPDAVYQFLWSPEEDNGAEFFGKKLRPDHQCKYIPEWYMHWLNSVPS